MKGHPERKNPKRKGRSRQRQRALDIMYEADVRGFFRAHRLERAQKLLEQRQSVSTAQVPIKEYGVQIVQTYLDNADDVDSIIDAASPDWALNRMSAVDRSILRISATEIMHLDIERPIAVKEAASLAREFSADKSVPFVMGVLNRVADIRDLETSGTGFDNTDVLGEDYVPSDDVRHAHSAFTEGAQQEHEQAHPVLDTENPVPATGDSVGEGVDKPEKSDSLHCEDVHSDAHGNELAQDSSPA